MTRLGTDREMRTNIRFRICPVTGGVPTKMTHRAFADMCTKFRTGKAKTLSPTGTPTEISRYEMERMACIDCKGQIKDNQHKITFKPKELTILTKKKLRELCLPERSI